MSKTYRSAKGVNIDMEALRLQNENAVALGNMKVNARGDLLGKGGKVVQSAHERTRSYYEDNPKAVKKSGVSLKDEVVDETVQEEAVIETPKAKTKQKAKPKAKQIEKELEDGSIEILNPETDEGNKL